MNTTIRVSLFCKQPLLASGLKDVLDQQGGFELSTCPDMEIFANQLQGIEPDVILLEVTRDISLEVLTGIKRLAKNASVILWVDTIAHEFAAQAISLGIRGILRRSLSVELQVKCLERVAAGELWVEKSLSDQLISTKRVVLSPRERQLIALLAQGLKNKEIAHALGITEGTAKVYLSRLFDKVGASDRFELALFALKNLNPSAQPAETAANRAPFTAGPATLPMMNLSV